MEERYQILSQIAAGGTGSVYKAWDTSMERNVALKRLSTGQKQHGADSKETGGISRVTSSLSALQHPNLVTVFDIGEDSQGVFVVMELLDGPSFHDLAGVSVSAPLFHDLATQCLEGIQAAEQQKVLHGDLKPTDIMVVKLPGGRDQVKILDFGFSEFTERPDPDTIDQHPSLAASVPFMSPERFQQAPLDVRSDIYSLGCVFYHLLTRRYPFNGPLPSDIMRAHLAHHLRPLEEHRPDLPPALCQWVMWLMNLDPENRPVSAQQALEYLPQKNALKSTSTAQPAAPTGATGSVVTVRHPTARAPVILRQSSKSSPLPWILVGIGLLAALAAFLMLRKPADNPTPGSGITGPTLPPPPATAPVTSLEPFDYPPSDLVRAAKGEGWKTPWSAPLKIVPGNMTEPAKAPIPGGAHLVAGASFSRELGFPLRNGSYWVSFVARLQLSGSLNEGWAGIALCEGEKEHLFIGKSRWPGEPNDVWGMGTDAAKTFPKENSPPVTSNCFIVARIDLKDPVSTVTLWLNPPRGSTPGYDLAHAALPNLPFSTVDTIRVVVGGSTASLHLDDLRVSPDAAAVMK